MKRDNKTNLALSWLGLTVLAAVLVFLPAAPVSAAVEGFVARSIDGNYHQYSYEELLDSYALKLLGIPNGLYEDFSAKKPVAFFDSFNGYIDYSYSLEKYVQALLSGQEFDLNSYTESSSAKKILMPAEVKVVSLAGTEIVRGAVNISQPRLVPVNPVSTVHETDKPVKLTPLVSASGVTMERAQQWAAGRRAHQRFIDIAPLYWKYAVKTGLCPEVLYAQSALETNFGHYTGIVPPEYNNWAGLKTAAASGDEPEDHQQFATAEDGVRAHFNHMAAYTGLSPVGETHGRYDVVLRLSWAGKITAVEELSGRWALSPTYHLRILSYLGEMK